MRPEQNGMTVAMIVTIAVVKFINELILKVGKRLLFVINAANVVVNGV